jgi:type II secretory ATPase GspE/PulE/Tfp pilus assembly ATPase PilB-like protein
LAALTGHLVFSTLHTNDASRPSRVLSIWEWSPVCPAPQRLVRMVCPHCKEKHLIDPEIATILQLDQSES